MSTVYELRGFMRRQAISVGIAVVVFIYGLWELYRASTGADSLALIFGLAFCGGGVFAARQLLIDSRNQVASMEIDADGGTAITLWRPTGALRLTAPADALTDWRYYVKIQGRGAQRPYLRVTHPDHPDQLELEMRADVTVTEALRKLAPEAVADYEAALTGGLGTG